MSFKEAIDSAARAYLFRVISQANGNGAKAAKIAGVCKPQFYRLLRRYGIITGRMREAKSAFEQQGFQSMHQGGRRR